MDLRPWGYWMPDGRPHEGTAEIVALTERMIGSTRNTRAPCTCTCTSRADHDAGARRAAADTLLTLMPAAGHMVHMPSHIYQRVGRYADAMKSNRWRLPPTRTTSPSAARRACTRWVLPAQRALPVVCRHGRRPEQRRHRGRPEGRLEGRRRAARSCRCWPASASSRTRRTCASGSWQEMLADRNRPPARVPARRLALRARPAFVATGDVADGRAGTRRARRRSDGQGLDQPLFSPNTGRAHPVDRRRSSLARSPPRAGFTPPSPVSRKPCGSRTRSCTPSRPNGTRRRGSRSAPSCSRPAGRPKPKRSTGRTCGARATTAGRSSASSRRSRAGQGRSGRDCRGRFKKAWARADITLTASRFGRAVNVATGAGR